MIHKVDFILVVLPLFFKIMLEHLKKIKGKAKGYKPLIRVEKKEIKIKSIFFDYNNMPENWLIGKKMKK